VHLRVFVINNFNERRYGRAVRHTAFVLGSFERSLRTLGEDIYIVLVSWFLNVIVQRGSDPTDKNRILLFIYSICEDTSKDNYWIKSYSLSSDTTYCPKLTLSHLGGRKHGEIAKI